MRVTRIYTNVNMGLSHDGLLEVLKKNKIPLTAGDDAVIFLNRKRDKVKVLTAHGAAILYARSPKALTVQAVLQLPTLFQNYSRLESEKRLQSLLTQAMNTPRDQEVYSSGVPIRMPENKSRKLQSPIGSSANINNGQLRKGA